MDNNLEYLQGEEPWEKEYWKHPSGLCFHEEMEVMKQIEAENILRGFEIDLFNSTVQRRTVLTDAIGN